MKWSRVINYNDRGCGWIWIIRLTGQYRENLTYGSKLDFSTPVKYFTDRSKAVLLLWIFYVCFLSCVCYAFVRVCLYVPWGHLLGKGWPLGSRLWCLTVSLSLSHWYPGSGVVLDCIDSWSLHRYLVSFYVLHIDFSAITKIIFLISANCVRDESCREKMSTKFSNGSTIQDMVFLCVERPWVNS